MELIIKITIGLFIFSLLLIFFKITKEFRENNEKVTINSHDPIIYQKPVTNSVTQDDEDLINNIIWEIENN